MAAALAGRGHRVLADDVAVVRATPGGAVVLPGFPQLKLWPESAARLGIAPESLPRLRPALEKRAYRIDDQFQTRPAPLARVYVLADADDPAISALSPQDAVIELIRHSFAARVLEATTSTATHLQRCAALAGHGLVRSLQRPKRWEALPEVLALVEQDIARASAAA